MTFRNLRAAMGLNRTPQPPLSLLSPTPMGPGPLAWRHQSLPSDTAAVVVPAPKSSALPGTSANVPTWPWPVPVPMGMPKAHGWVCLQLPPCSVLFPGWGQRDQRGLWCLALLAPTQIPPSSPALREPSVLAAPWRLSSLHHCENRSAHEQSKELHLTRSIILLSFLTQNK